MSTVSTTWPLALTISTFTLVAAEASSKPPLPVLSSMVTVEPSVNTLRPTRAVPCMTCSELNCAGHAGHGLVQLLDAGHRVDLRHLRCHLGVVQRVHRVLVVQLRHQQFQETGPALPPGRWLASEALVLPVVVPAVAWVGLMIMRISPGCRVRYWPICRVLRSSVLAVFMTSTLFWYEREAEIMFTISSTAFTLEWFT